jgi:hypothetical protein
LPHRALWGRPATAGRSENIASKAMTIISGKHLRKNIIRTLLEHHPMLFV